MRVHICRSVLLLGSDRLPLLIVRLHLQELNLLFEAGNFALTLIFVKGFLGHELTTKILNLEGEFLFDGLIFFSHNVSPNNVELIEDVGNASLSHFGFEGLLDLLDLLDSCSWNPLIGISILLLLGFSLVSLNSKLITNRSSTTSSTQELGLSHDLDVVKILILASLLEQVDQLLIISLHIVELNMNTSLSLPGSIEVLHALLKIPNLISKPVVLTTLKLQLLLDISHPLIHLLES